MAELRKYGTETRIYFPLVDFGATDYVAGVTIAAGDATISKDAGAFANIVGESDDDVFVDEGGGLYSIKVAASELECKTAVIRIVDQTGTKEWEDQMLLIDTYGNASAQHVFDLGTAMASQTVGTCSSVTAIAADGITAASLKADALTAIESEANDALVALNLDHLLKTDTTVAADGDLEDYVVAGTVMAHLMSASADVTTFKATTDSLEAIKVHADTIKAETASIQVETTALDTLTKAAGDGDLAAILADTNELQSDDYPTSIAAVKSVVDDILEDTGTDIPGTITTAQNDLDIITGATGVNLLDATQASIDAIETDTTTDIPALIATAQADLDIITDTDGVILGADAITAIWAKAMSDLAQGAPSATASVLTAINWLYEAWRNKTETTATTTTIYKDDGTTELAKSTLSDNGTTFTKAEFVTGA